MHLASITGSVKILAVLILFLAGLTGSFILGVVLLGQVFHRLKGWDTPCGRLLRVPVGIIAFAVGLAVIVGLMILLAFLLDRGLAKYW
jgi:cytochrome c biogenesis protein CcdA